MSLTGKSITGAEAYHFGLATHFVEDSDFDNLIEALKHENTEDALMAFHRHPPSGKSEIFSNLDEICYIFNGNSFEEILGKLRMSNSKFGQETLKTVLNNCPLSVKASFALF